MSKNILYLLFFILFCSSCATRTVYDWSVQQDRIIKIESAGFDADSILRAQIIVRKANRIFKSREYFETDLKKLRNSYCYYEAYTEHLKKKDDSLECYKTLVSQYDSTVYAILSRNSFSNKHIKGSYSNSLDCKISIYEKNGMNIVFKEGFRNAGSYYAIREVPNDTSVYNKIILEMPYRSVQIVKVLYPVSVCFDVATAPVLFVTLTGFYAIYGISQKIGNKKENEIENAESDE